MKIFLDMDGVTVDWLGPACQLMGLNEKAAPIRNFLKEGGWFEDLCSHDAKYRMVQNAKNGNNFFENLPKLPWADRLYNELLKNGTVCFLTSPGNAHEDREYVAYCCYGKVKWLAENYPGCSFLIGRQKYFAANSDSILIDDHERNIRDFQSFGGNVFKWPCQYSLIDGEISVDEMLDKLLTQIKKET